LSERERRKVMERVYYKRDRRIVVEEIPDVRAVQLSANDRGVPRASAESFGTSAVETVRSNVSMEFPEDEDPVTTFEQANWRFVTPSAEMTRAFSAGESVRDAEEVGKVIIGRSGSVAVATNRLNVQLQSALSEEECEAILSEKNLDVLTKLNFAPNLYEIVAQGREDALAASVELHEDERFTLAEPALIEHIPQRLTPNDPRYTEQWQWNNTGQNGGATGADVSAEEAWESTRGGGVRVAVIDNGFDADHEDLAAGVSAMSGYFSSSDGGAAASAAFTQSTARMPDNNHGTFCAGIVGARHNNGNGGCGIAPECELTLIACLGDQVGTQTTLARAVAYATNPRNENVGTEADGADILVSSLGPNGAVWDLTVTLELALEAAGTNGRSGRGLPIFWAASNGNNVNVTLDEVVSQGDVIAIVRSDRDDQEDNAARGETVDLIAPGVDVFSTRSGNVYGTSTGTSFAAPCAAGCAALALSVNPGLTRDELRQIMFDSADKIGGVGVVYDANGHNDDYGFGRANANQAVLRAASSIPSTVPRNDI
jgi:subtilisin family serine protease